MILGLDYWNVVSHHPGYFRGLAFDTLHARGEVHVISAITRKRAGTVAAEVAALRVPCTAVHEVMFTRPRSIPALKLAKCQALGVDVYYDDRDDVCRLLAEHGILALRVTRPDRRSDMEAERA